MYFEVNKELRLKLLRPEDAEAIFELTDKSREHLRTWLPWVDSTTSKDDTLSFIKMTMRQFANDQGFQMGIWYKGEIAGVVGHHNISWVNKSTTLGYWLGREFTGKGIMTASCKAIIDFTFSELGLNTIEIAAATGNTKSRAVPERLGFQLDGVLRQREWLYDHFVDHAIYSLIRSEWNQK